MKRMLCLFAVLFAMSLALMPQASAMDFEPPETSMVSQHDADTAPGVPIDADKDFPLFAAVVTHLGNEKTHTSLDFVTGLRNIAIFSKVNGGGLVLAHGGKAVATS